MLGGGGDAFRGGGRGGRGRPGGGVGKRVGRPGDRPAAGGGDARLYRLQIRRGGADPGAGARADGRANLGTCGCALDPRYSGQPGGDAGGRPFALGIAHRSSGSHYLPRLAGQSRNAWSRDPRLRWIVIILSCLPKLMPTPAAQTYFKHNLTNVY